MAEVYLEQRNILTGRTEVRPIDDPETPDHVVAIDIELESSKEGIEPGLIEVLLTKEEVNEVYDKAFNR